MHNHQSSQLPILHNHQQQQQQQQQSLAQLEHSPADLAIITSLLSGDPSINPANLPPHLQQIFQSIIIQQQANINNLKSNQRIDNNTNNLSAKADIFKQQNTSSSTKSSQKHQKNNNNNNTNSQQSSQSHLLKVRQ